MSDIKHNIQLRRKIIDGLEDVYPITRGENVLDENNNPIKYMTNIDFAESKLKSIYNDNTSEEVDITYNNLNNKPKINNVELSGNKTFNQLGLDNEYKPLYISNYTLEKAVWMEDKQGDTEKWYYLIQTNKVTANSIVNIYMDLENQEKLTSGYTESKNGSLTIYTDSKPEGNVVVNIEITKSVGGTSL